MPGNEVTAGSKVTLHFSLALEDGSIVDSNFEAEPAALTIGDGTLPEGFEQYLLGLQTGQEASFQVPPVHGFGEPNDENLHRINRVRFDANLDIVPGLVLSFADANKTEVPGVVKDIDGDIVTVDFNHPLAGRELTFRVAIVAIEV